MENEHPADNQSFWQQFFGPNFGYILELYEAYREDPESVSEETRVLFTEHGDPNAAISLGLETTSSGATGQTNLSSIAPQRIAQAIDYARNIRMYGHLAATTDPIHPAQAVAQLEAATYRLHEADLTRIPATVVWPDAPADVRTASQAIDRLKAAYTGRHGYEFNQVVNPEERAWLEQKVERGEIFKPLFVDEQKKLLRQLAQAELFEKFLHRQYVGQKRFSVEGLDALVPMVDTLAFEALDAGTDKVIIAMSHRGRLNVLAHVLKKPYENIFSEIHSGHDEAGADEMATFHQGWAGDVKYHMGWRRAVQKADGSAAQFILPSNPSHLEVVDPVAEGIARAAQDDRTHKGAPVHDVRAALPIVVHGDAAFAGEGVVAETFNFSLVEGYHTGGTVHIIANNHVGFTADPDQGRSTRYASDPAKGYEVPVVHVSADDPEACLAAVRFAFLYRETFHKDFLIDLIGYRRWGHNEMDDPMNTQPVLYREIGLHKTVKTLYGQALMDAGVVTAAEIGEMEAAINDELKAAQQKSADMHPPALVTDFSYPQVEVPAVSADELREINAALLVTPADFTVYPKLKKILDRRTNAIDGGDIEWAHAEALAFATILQEGTPIRLTGQDSERGTFGQRHLVLHDVNDGRKYTPLQHLPQAEASFEVHNSPLSETSLIGFEYGYNVEAKNTLVLWEAQFGDFVNVAQPMIDQFIAAGYARWGEASGLVLLLPHGYEGQAAEHSSGRVERFLQLAANNNFMVANVTTSAQYFHLLRLQAARLGDNARPLILMTPKSLLRSPHASSKSEDLVAGQFEPVLHQVAGANPDKVTRLVLSSGKVGVDLTTELANREGNFDWLAAARVEQLYPFPSERVQEIVAQYQNLEEVVWLQEEPQNSGGWCFVEPRLRSILPEKVSLQYIGRFASASPAEGSADVHNAEQARIIDGALTQHTL